MRFALVALFLAGCASSQEPARTAEGTPACRGSQEDQCRAPLCSNEEEQGTACRFCRCDGRDYDWPTQAQANLAHTYMAPPPPVSVGAPTPYAASQSPY